MIAASHVREMWDIVLAVYAVGVGMAIISLCVWIYAAAVDRGCYGMWQRGLIWLQYEFAVTVGYDLWLLWLFILLMGGWIQAFWAVWLVGVVVAVATLWRSGGVLYEVNLSWDEGVSWTELEVTRYSYR